MVEGDCSGVKLDLLVIREFGSGSRIANTQWSVWITCCAHVCQINLPNLGAEASNSKCVNMFQCECIKSMNNNMNNFLTILLNEITQSGSFSLKLHFCYCLLFLMLLSLL